MKILHTADWHLNDKLGQQDRTDHLRRRVEQVAEIGQREAIDVLLIAGDLFSERAKPEQVAESFRHLRKTFAAFFAQGGIILAVTGNHDQDGRVRPFIDLARAGMDIAEPPKSRGEYFQPRRMYLLDTTFVGRVRDLREQFDVQFVLLPFPNNSRVLTGTETATTAGQFNRLSQEAVSNWLRQLPDTSGYDVRLRTVLMAHLHVIGADVGPGSAYVSDESDIRLDAAALPIGFDYIALGHVHKPQILRDAAHIRYAGSLDRMDFSECGQEKSVILVDLGPNGRRDKPVPIPLESTSLVDVQIDDANITPAALAAQVPDVRAALVRITVSPDATANTTEILHQTIREVLPNVTRVVWQPPQLNTNPIAHVLSADKPFRARVLDYLEGKIEADDRHRQELLDLATRFLDSRGAS